jgi:hypothetical protein
MPELKEPIIAALLVAAVLVGLAAAAVILRRTARRRLEPLVAAFELGTTRLSGLFFNSVEGLSQGYSCRYTVESASQYSPGGATLRLAATSPLQWSAGIKDLGSRLMVRVGMLRDQEIGDDELDHRLRFSSTDEMALLSLFGQQRARSALRVLSQSDNFNSITVRAERIDIKWTPRRPQLDENPEVLRVRLAASVELSSSCGYSPRMG